MLNARWMAPRWKKALVKMRHHSPCATAEALIRFCAPSGPTDPPNIPPPSVAPLLRNTSTANRPMQMPMMPIVT